MDLFEGKYYRAYASVNLNAIRYNLSEAQKSVGKDTGIIAVIKTDAYGHGALAVAHAITDMVAGFAVATVDEAVELRNDGIDKPILILGYVSEKEYNETIYDDVIVPVYTYEQAKAFSEHATKLARTAHCHIKVDTGMNRIGFAAKNDADIANSARIIAEIKKLPNLVCDGIFTHFATADEADKVKTHKQYDNFISLINALKNMGITFTYHHCSNSAAIIDLPEFKFEWVRQGISLYGLKPSDELQNHVKLWPAMELKSHVVHIKEIEPGEEVSYGGIYVADKKRRIATVSIGYGDGYPRMLSNVGYVLIRGKKAPIVGRICMDQFMVDISDIDGVKMEDVVTLVGKDGDEVITFEELGAMCKRFNYEFVCDISKRVNRIYTLD